MFDHTSILKTILAHNRDKFSNDVLTSFGPRVSQAADLSAVLDLRDPRPSPRPFIRRRQWPPHFGEHVDLGTLLGITTSVSTLPPLTPLSGITPRELSISERTVPPGAHFEPDDFHGALYKLVRPRKL